MANTNLYTALAIIIVRIPHPAQGLILLVWTAVILYQSCRRQVELGADQDIPTEAQSLEPPAAATSAVTRPSLRRRNCFVLGSDGLTSHPLSSVSASAPSETADPEGYETAPEAAAPARTMAEKRAVAYFEERLRRHQESVSSQASASLSVQTALTDTQVKEHSDAADVNEGEGEAIKRRNVKMREEGVRVNVKYPQLASLKPATAPRPEPAPVHNNDLPPSPSPSSGRSTSPSLAGLQSPTPAPTPVDGATGITTPQGGGGAAPGVPASVLPTSGRAGAALDNIDEKLLAVPADPVSRRLLRDGRAILHRAVASAEGGRPGGRTGAVEGGVRTSGRGYPSELMD